MSVVSQLSDDQLITEMNKVQEELRTLIDSGPDPVSGEQEWEDEKSRLRREYESLANETTARYPGYFR